jgi:effector-binding domain-containing protein
MLKIGEFSRLSRVSVKALRHYDEIGLLRPVRVDPSTGYRFYSHDQLPRLNRILALRELGFTLEQVGKLLEEGITADQLRGMLRLRRAELVQELDEGRERLARVEARLAQIEQEGRMPEYEVVVKKVEPQLVASVRDRLSSYKDIGRLFGELYAYLGPLGAAGLGGSLWHDGEFKESDVDGEAISFLSRPVPEGGRVRVYELPGTTVASLVHRGPVSSIDQAYAALMTWIESNGYRLAGPDRELYLKGGADPNDPSYVTEIQQPVVKA